MLNTQEKHKVYVIAKAKWKVEKIYGTENEKEEDREQFYVANDHSYHTPFEVVEVYESERDAKKVLARNYPEEFISKHIQTISSGASGRFKEIREFVEYRVYAQDCELKFDAIRCEMYTYINNQLFYVVPDKTTDDPLADCDPY